ncbi:hypothetical protein AB0N07_42795 [Streptomyces sp. NPDC051172]|uniref:hypothetical protein n=1 Tax=Streptomyces sp. NPDC051172 TaxID=3155796 RepID=UPI00341E32F3
MIESLGSFGITLSYHRDETVWEVREEGTSAPAARVRRPGPPEAKVPCEVYAGRRLDEFVGLVTARDAAGPDRALVGRVHSDAHPNPFKDQIRVDQFGLGILEGKATGLGSLVRNSVGRFNFDSTMGDLVAPLTLRFSGPEGVAFELTRHAGALTRFDAKVTDPRVNRLLVLSVVRLFELKTGGLDPRKLRARMGGLFGRS